MFTRRIGSLLVVVVVAWSTLFSQSAHPTPNPYHDGEGWGKLPPGRPWGHVMGVDVDSHDNVWAFDRCGTIESSCVGSNVAPILEFDSHGNFLQSFGSGMFVLPHGLYVDHDDNIWVTDVQVRNGRGVQVFKFSPKGKLLLTLGMAGVVGTGTNTFIAPVGVVVAKNGDIFVADGHGGEFDGKNIDARIVKFSKDGHFLKAWGDKGSGPGQFGTLHGIALDSHGRIIVADRGNSRIEVFDQNGKFLEQWKQYGRPVGIFVDAHDKMYVADSDSNLPPWHDPRVTNNVTNRDLKAIINPGFTQGISIVNLNTEKLEGFVPPVSLGPGVGNWSLPESIAVDSKGNIYAAEARTMNLRKYSKID